MKLIDPATGQAVWDSNDPNAGPVPPAPEGRQWVRVDEPGDTMAPRRTAPGILDIGNGVTERLAFLNQTFNPVEGIGSAMRAGSRMVAPDQSYWDRIASLGEMASGVASIAAPIAAAKAIGVPAASAMMEGLLGASPTSQAAADMARGFVTDESGALRLYHGSPHDFDRFSMGKIGTGEGNQAYGHGLYFAENEGIARGYRDALTTPVDYRGQGYPGADTNLAAKKVADAMGPNSAPANVIASEASKYRYQAQQLRVDRGNQSGAAREANERLAASFEKIAADIEGLNPDDFRLNTGRLYEVNVNANPEDFLDWDKPLSEQSQAVRDVLGKFGLKHDEAASNDFDNALLAALFDDAPGPLPKRPINPTGNDIYMRSALRNFAVQDAAGKWGPGASTYDESLAAAGGDPKRVRAISTGSAPDRSEALRRAGIPGIRYLDAGSRGAGDGSRNYVVFDENLINIVRKYGVAGAATMLGVSAFDVEQAMAENMSPSQWDQLVVGPQ